MKHLSTILLCLAIGFAATNLYAQVTWFTGAISDNWSVPGNWTNGVPTADVEAVIGDANQPSVSCTVYAGTIGEARELSIAGYWDFGVGHYTGSGTLTVQPGASVTVTDHSRWGLGKGDDGSMATVNVGGTLNMNGGVDIAGYSPARVTLDPGGTLYVEGNLNIGHPSYMSEGWNYEINQLGGTVEVGTWGGGFYMSGWAGTTTSLYKASGTSLIRAGGVNGYTGNGFWQMGGTFEIAGDVTLESPGGAAIFGTDWANVEHSPIIKFSGTDPKLTVSSFAYGVHMAYPDGMGGIKAGSIPVQIDVSELNLSQVRTWVTIIDVVEGTLQFGDQVGFVAGTAPNDWDLQVVGNEVQVKDNYCTNVIDDDELSLLLAHWGEPWPPGFPDPDPGTVVDDDDLSMLLANWGECADGWMWPGPWLSLAPSVPEPATALILLLGLACAARRRMRR